MAKKKTIKQPPKGEEVRGRPNFILGDREKRIKEITKSNTNKKNKL